ncbi:hypothetical protein ACLQ25_09460 [Micromonospora sp. DT44]|uniref:hypothetical protein n=1 Tax=Micromonospora sp. DT44 TaxID=3393439 RepID=UPI003CEB07B0
MAWVVAPNIKALFASVNKLAPARDKTSDGTIGDLAHSTGVSGHNPDDTAGVRAERSDSDTTPEVRAGDIDRDLRIDHIPGDDMEAVVQKVVRTPALRRRLIYVIYNRRIWSASSGWAQQPYSGSNPHDHHAHFSGDPAYDNDGSPWREIEALAQEDDMTPEEHNWLATVHKNLTVMDGRNPIGQAYTRITDGTDAVLGAAHKQAFPSLAALGKQLTAVQTALTALAGRDFTDEAAIVRDVLAGLTPERIAAAIPEALTEQVADALAKRLQG